MQQDIEFQGCIGSFFALFDRRVAFGSPAMILAILDGRMNRLLHLTSCGYHRIVQGAFLLVGRSGREAQSTPSVVATGPWGAQA
jgi:hypothetical protein